MPNKIHSRHQIKESNSLCAGVILLIIILLVASGLVYLHKYKATLVNTQPIELALWYKPEYKRKCDCIICLNCAVRCRQLSFMRKMKMLNIYINGLGNLMNITLKLGICYTLGKKMVVESHV